MPSNGRAAVHSVLLIYAAGGDPIESAAAALQSGNCARPKKERSRRRMPLYVAKHLPIYASVNGFAPFLFMREPWGNENGAASLAQGLQSAMALRVRRGSLILWTSTSALSAILPMTWTFFLDREPESGAMEQLRSEHLSLFECLAVVAALALQIASLLALLQEHAGR